MNMMRTLKTFILVLGTILATFTMYSCLDDDSNSSNKYSFGIATIKPLGN